LRGILQQLPGCVGWALLHLWWWGRSHPGLSIPWYLPRRLPK
jgi:hypothetical protein